MTDGHYIHHSPLLPRPLMCPRLIFTSCFHIAGERGRYVEDRRKNDEINKQRRWECSHSGWGGGQGEVGMKRGGSSRKIGSQYLVFEARSSCGAQKSLTHEPLWGRGEEARTTGRRGKKTKEARLLLLPVPLLRFRHFSQFSTAFPLMGLSGARAYPNRLGARGGLQGVASSL